MKKNKILLGLLSFISSMAIAQIGKANGLRLGMPGYAGTGCPSGSASVTLSPDETELSILFDSFLVEAGGDSRKRIDRKNCSLAVPVAVPQGYSVAIIKADYRGFNAVPRGGMNRLTNEYFWAGQTRGVRTERTFYGPLNSDYTETDELIASAVVWTRCGDSFNLRINTSIMTQTNSRLESSLGSVDSIDISNGLIYHLQWRRCN